MKINIGAGYTRYDGYLNCDRDVNSNPDFVFDMEKDTWPFDDNSVDAVIAYHVLEHLGDGYFHALKELYRVCKDGALIDIRVPHYAHHNFFHDPTHRRPITPVGLELFNRMNNYHSSNASSKLGIAFDIDLRVIDYKVNVDSRYDYLKNAGNNAIEIYAFNMTNIIEEYEITVQVVKMDPKLYTIYGYFRSLLGRLANENDIQYCLDLNCSDEELKRILMDSREYKLRHGIIKDDEDL